MKTSKLIVLLVIIGLLFVACTANPIDLKQCVHSEPDGFWSFLWHGWIAPITFICSLIDDSIRMYSVNNSGGWYDFGFVLGSGTLTIVFASKGKKGKPFIQIKF